MLTCAVALGVHQLIPASISNLNKACRVTALVLDIHHFFTSREQTHAKAVREDI